MTLSPTSTPSQSQPLTRHGSRKRTRFTFFVGRKKVAPTRAVSVRRNHSRHRRAPSVSATTHKRTSAIRLVGEQPKQPSQDQNLIEAEPDTHSLHSSSQPTTMDQSGMPGQGPLFTKVRLFTSADLVPFFSLSSFLPHPSPFITLTPLLRDCSWFILMFKDSYHSSCPHTSKTSCRLYLILSSLSYRPMASSSANRKDADLPPLPPQNATPEVHKSGGGIMKKLTTKLRRSSTSQPNPPAASTHNAPPLPSSSKATAEAGPSAPPKKRKTTLKLPSMPSMPKGPAPAALPNSFTSPEQRQAALRAMGLIPAVPHPYKDSHGYMVPLSEQEKYLDNRFSVVADNEPRESDSDDGESEAKKIREAWLRKNREAEAEPFGSSSQGEPSSPTSESAHYPQHHTSTSVSSQPSSNTPSSPRGSTSADVYRSSSSPSSKNALTATERASALAISNPEMMVKVAPSSQSPRRGTFVEVHPSHSTTPLRVDYHLEPESPSDKDNLQSTLDSQDTQTTPSIVCTPLPPPPRQMRTRLERLEVEVDPTSIPLPASPAIGHFAEVQEVVVESGKDLEVDGESKKDSKKCDVEMLSPISTSSEVSERVSRWLQSTPTGSSFQSSQEDKPNSSESPFSTSVDADTASGEDSPIDKSLPAIIEVSTPTPSTPALSPSSLAPPSPITPLTSPTTAPNVDLLEPTPVAPLAIKTDSNNTITPNNQTEGSTAQDADAGTTVSPISIRGRKEKPSPISITATAIAVQTSVSAPPTASAVSIPIPIPAVAPGSITIQSPESPSSSPSGPESTSLQSSVSFQDQHLPKQALGSLPKLSISPPTASSPNRGRSLTVSHIHDHKHGAAELSLSSSTSTSDTSRSRSKVPALSPTRTTSSSAASEVPPTPTTTTAPSQRGRKVSIVSSTSQSSDNHHHHHLHHQYGVQIRGNPRIKVQTAPPPVKTDEMSLQLPPNVATVIVESPIEDVVVSPVISLNGANVVNDSEKVETVAKEDVDTPLPAAIPRPRMSRPSEESVERRKSLTFGGLFGKSHNSLNVAVPEKPSKPRSMSNLRKSVAGTISAKFRPKTLVVDTSKLGSRNNSPSPARRPSPASSSPLNPNPLSPTSPATTYFSARSNGSVTSPTSSNGHRSNNLEPVARPRLRQPLSPTIHSRGSILMEARGLEDDESRRLAEMAFLDF
ncbi:hypothetical protein QCA50_005648 [Cerrena zonata]|uniref:Uncharacterized protein n=1 Tax=Cerrena zonata TaxID=2478898 RepID=A0AAW0GN13_9APHY